MINGFDGSRKSAPGGDPTARPDALELLRRDLGRLGLDVEPLLKPDEPPREGSAPPSSAPQRPSSLQVASIYAAAVKQSGDELLGLRLGLLRSREWLGTFGELLAHAPTVRDAIEQAQRFVEVLVEGQTLTLEEKEHRSRLTTALPEALIPAGRRVILQSTAVVCANLLVQVLQRPLLSVELMIPDPAPGKESAEVAALRDRGWQVSFGAREYGIGFPNAYLELAPRTRRPEEYERLLEALQQEKSELESKDDVRRRVRSYLVLNLSRRWPRWPGPWEAARESSSSTCRGKAPPSRRSWPSAASSSPVDTCGSPASPSA